MSESPPCGCPVAFVVVLTAIVVVLSLALLVAVSRSHAMAADLSVRIDGLNAGYSELSSDRDLVLAKLADLTFAAKPQTELLRSINSSCAAGGNTP